MVLGFAGLVARLFAAPQSHRLATVVALVLALWVAGRGAVAAVPLLSGADTPDVLTRHPLLRSPTLPPSIPIVVSDSATFVQLEHYAPPALNERLRAITVRRGDVQAEFYEDSSQRALDALRRWHALAVVAYDDLGRRKERFVVYGDPSWLLGRLSRDGARLELLGTHQPLLILVTPGS